MFADFPAVGVHVEARKEEKRKKHVLPSVVFSRFAHTGLYVTPVRGKKGGKNEKNTF